MKELVPPLGQMFCTSVAIRFLAVVWDFFKTTGWEAYHEKSQKYFLATVIATVVSTRKRLFLSVHKTFITKSNFLWLHLYREWLKKIPKCEYFK
jgi:hypothetical protein